MRRQIESAKKQPKQRTKMQLGVFVNRQLWMEFRANAIMSGETATQALEAAMREALRKQGQAGV